MTELSACQVDSTPVFYLRSVCFSKPQTSETFVLWTHTDPLRVGSHWAVAHASLSQKMIAWPYSGLKFMVCAAQCQCQHLLLSASVFAPILGAGQWHLPGFLPLESPCHLYQAHSKQGNYFKFPCDSRSSDHASCSWVSALLPHWNPLSLSGATFKTSESVLCWYFNPLFFPSQWFWGEFSCAICCTCFHIFFSLFISLFSLEVPGSCLPNAHGSFLLQISPQFPTSMRWSFFLLIDMQLCSFSHQIDFLGVKQDLIFI